MTKPTRDRITGCLYGICIGDALGAPAESMSFERIRQRFGRITTYHPTVGHKYYPEDRPPGSPTDDWQLTKATAEALLESDGFDIATIARHHVAAMEQTTAGWGRTTREAVRRLKKGVPPDQAAVSADNRGTGNGVAMKAAPLALWAASRGVDYRTFVEPFARLTHNTRIAVASAAAMVAAVQYCLGTRPEQFDTMTMKEPVLRAVRWAEQLDHVPELGAGLYECGHTLDPPTRPQHHRLSDPLGFLDLAHRYSPGRLIESFKGGCYVFESLPFAFMFFAQNPTIDALFDVASAGGDTDSNAAMVGALLGALHGMSVFPPDLVAGLANRDEVASVAEGFASRFAEK